MVYVHHGYLAALTLILLAPPTIEDQSMEARAYLAGYNPRAETLYHRSYLAAWDYYTNITDVNRDAMTAMHFEVSQFTKEEATYVKQAFDVSNVTDVQVRRQLEFILDVGIAGYNDSSVLRKIADIQATMTGVYSSAKWCKTPTQCLSLEPDLVRVMTTSRDYNELRDAWKGWRDASGAKMKRLYEEFVTLSNMALTAQGRYADLGEYYRSGYETPTFETDVRRLYEKIQPLYRQLHAYVRRKLRDKYGPERFPASGHIPAHLLGNMWAQQWSNIYDLLEPYPGQGRPSLTAEMQRQNYTVTDMYRTAEEFFTSIGLGRMSREFWENSMLEKPRDREVVCHASAWDFNNGTDFRIKQCTEVTEDQLKTVHHEMGHIEYYMEYINQPVLFRTGANPGFHEGVADIVTLSFMTPEHLQKIGLVQDLPSGTEADINFLFQMALDRVAFLPFGYLIDLWRWSVYRNDTRPSTYNKDWWDLRCRYQGVSPPVARSEDDFDPGAKYHIPGDVPYIRYFVSFIVQFQWHKALCEVAGHQGPLHRCDIYRSKAAGSRLRDMLAMGKSRPWGEAMMTLTKFTTGETNRMSVAPLLEYFHPLQVWLEKENARSGEPVSWDAKCPDVPVGGSTGIHRHTATLLPALLSALLLVVCYVLCTMYYM